MEALSEATKREKNIRLQKKMANYSTLPLPSRERERKVMYDGKKKSLERENRKVSGVWTELFDGYGIYTFN